MLHLATTLRVDLVINNDAEKRHGVERRVTLAKKSGESLDHVLMKLMGYGLFFHPELHIELAVGQHYKPDLVRLDEQGRPLVWIDCGSISPKKLAKLPQVNRLAKIVVIKPTLREVTSFMRSAGVKLPEERVCFITFRDGFLGDLAEALSDRARVVFTVVGDRDALYLDVNGASLETPILKR